MGRGTCIHHCKIHYLFVYLMFYLSVFFSSYFHSMFLRSLHHMYMYTQSTQLYHVPRNLWCILESHNARRWSPLGNCDLKNRKWCKDFVAFENASIFWKTGNVHILNNVVMINRALNRNASCRLSQWLNVIPHMIRSYYRCYWINEPVISSHCVYLKLGHRFHALLKDCSDLDDVQHWWLTDDQINELHVMYTLDVKLVK